MRKIITFFASIICVFTFGIHSARAQSALPSSLNPQFVSDITIEANSAANQRHVRVASAFNGWLFAAFVVNDSVSHKGGVELRYSKNGGINWYLFNGLSYFQHSYYSSCDITVTGADTSHINVYLGAVRKDLITKLYDVSVEKFNGAKPAYPLVRVFSQQLDTNMVYDLALASNSKYPTAKDSMSVGLLYSHHGIATDSMIFVTSGKRTGYKFGAHHVIATGKYYRKVSLAFGRSPSASKGAYFAAWEQDSSMANTLGHVFTSRTKFSIDSVWTSPTLVDTLFPAMKNHVRYPSIACQYNASDNDSSNLSVAIAFECARNGITDSMDILGVYNKRGDTTNYWNALAIANSTNNELQPSLSYDVSANNFMVTYYDSTAGSLPYLNTGFALATPKAWTVVKASYNDNSAGLRAPWPRVINNLLTNKAFFVWVNDPANKNGVALCDGEYLNTSVAELDMNGLRIYNLFPNPSSSAVTLPVSSDRAADLSLSVFNALGQSAMPVQIQHLAGGMQYFELDVTSLTAGIYLCRVQSGNVSHTLRFVVQR